MTLLTFRVILIAALAALIASPIARRIAQGFRLFDLPGSALHKQHQTPVVLAGGIAMFIAVLFTTAAVFQMERMSLAGSEVLVILAGASLVFVVGLIDDATNLSAGWKLLGQVIAALLLVRLGVHIRILPNMWLNQAMTVFWLVGITNAYNFVDSMDGLAAGLAGLTSAFFVFVTLDSQQTGLSLLSAVLLGACIGEFYFNSSPAHFFLGDSGSLFLGFILAGIGIAYNPVGFSPLASWYVPVLLMAVPIFDTTLVVLSRLKHGLPVYLGRCDHTFHRLVATGMHPNRAVVTMHIAALLVGCLAFVALSLPPLTANAIFASCVGVGVVCFLYLERAQP